MVPPHAEDVPAGIVRPTSADAPFLEKPYEPLSGLEHAGLLLTAAEKQQTQVLRGGGRARQQLFPRRLRLDGRARGPRSKPAESAAVREHVSEQFGVSQANLHAL